MNETEILDYYEKQLSEIEEKRLKLDKEQTSLQKIVNGIKEHLGVRDSDVKQSRNELVDPPIPKNAFSGMTVMDAIEKYLKIVKQGRTARQITNALLKGGYNTDAKNFYDTVRVRLREKSKDGRIISINGFWELGEWHQKTVLEKTYEPEMSVGLRPVQLTIDNKDFD